jgi:Arc/MetJ-type ribon-helix-helix transcriptional regulator
MPITLSPETEALIQEHLSRGEFATVDDLLHAALSLLEQREFVSMATDEVLAAYPGIREKIEEGFADAEAGRLTDGEEFFAQLEREEQEQDRKARRTA